MTESEHEETMADVLSDNAIADQFKAWIDASSWIISPLKPLLRILSSI